jgi:hypothetical protein
MALARVDLPDEEQPFKNRIIFFPFGVQMDIGSSPTFP